MPTLHPRQEIREALVAALKGTADPRPTAAGERVFETRYVPWRTQQLPAISVYATSEPTRETSRSTAPLEYTRDLNMTVEAVLSANADADDALDAICLQIERAVHRDPTLGGKSSNLVLIETELGSVSAEGQVFAAAQLHLEVSYRSPAIYDEPEDDFETADIKHNLGGGVHPDNQAEDTVTLET